MVVFTCQHCNSSLKRSDIEKHYSFKCRRYPALTCMDCLKDFMGDEYKVHLTCVTEAERYGGADFVARPVAVKQNRWLDVCSTVLERTDLTNEQRGVINFIIGNPNIPRNRKKFHNFIKCTGSSFFQATGQSCKNVELIDSIFDLFDEAKNNQKKDNQENNNSQDSKTSNGEGEDENAGKRKRVDSAISDEVDESLNGLKEISERKRSKKKTTPGIKENGEQEHQENGVERGEIEIQSRNNNELSRKERKKLKKQGKIKIEEENNAEEINENLGEAKLRKQKKHMKKMNVIITESEENCYEKSDEGIKNEIPEINDVKKKKNNKENQAEENNKNEDLEEDPENAILAVQPEEKLSKKERKRRLREEKYKAELESIQNCEQQQEITENNEEECNKEKRKKLKKKKSSEVTFKNSNEKEKESNKEIEEAEEQPTEEITKPSKFNWEEIITEVLKSASDHEMSLKKLAKKVINEYQFRKGSREDYEKISAKFNKKINKTVGVRVLKDRAKLISA